MSWDGRRGSMDEDELSAFMDACALEDALEAQLTSAFGADDDDDEGFDGFDGITFGRASDVLAPMRQAAAEGSFSSPKFDYDIDDDDDEDEYDVDDVVDDNTAFGGFYEREDADADADADEEEEHVVEATGNGAQASPGRGGAKASEGGGGGGTSAHEGHQDVVGPSSSSTSTSTSTSSTSTATSEQQQQQQQRQQQQQQQSGWRRTANPTKAAAAGANGGAHARTATIGTRAKSPPTSPRTNDQLLGAPVAPASRASPQTSSKEGSSVRKSVAKLRVKRKQRKGKGSSGFQITRDTSSSTMMGKGTKPMPSIAQVDIAFNKLTSQLGIPTDRLTAMQRLPPDAKWQLICEHASKRTATPMSYVEALSRSPSLRVVQELQVELATAPIKWVEQFLAQDGHTFLILLLNNCIEDGPRANRDMTGELTRCVKNIMNTGKMGLDKVVGMRTGLPILARALEHLNAPNVIVVLEVMAAVCFAAEGGHARVLSAFREKDSFGRVLLARVVDYLSHPSHDLRLASIVFLNTLLSTKDKEALRDVVGTLYQLGLSDIMPSVAGLSDTDDWLQQVDVLYERLDQSVSSMGKRVRHVNLTTDKLFKDLDWQLKPDPQLHRLFREVLEDMLLIPKGTTGIHIWRTLQRMVAQLGAIGVASNPTQAIREAVLHALNATDISFDDDGTGGGRGGGGRGGGGGFGGGGGGAGDVGGLLTTISDLEALNAELVKQLRTHEPAFNVQALKQKLDASSPAAALAQAAAAAGSSAAAAAPVSATMATNAPAPPPPPGIGGMPPPPPPPPGGAALGPPKKKAIKPSVKMLALPWTTIKPHQLAGTAWEQLSDDSMLPLLDRNELERLFKKVMPTTTTGDGARKAKKAQKERTVILLDARRHQNISVMLSRFRLPFSSIRKALMALDTEVLTAERLYLMKPFTPQQEEAELLRRYEGERRLLGPPERFFYAVMDVPRMAQRVSCMLYNLNFKDRVTDLRHHLTVSLSAVREVRTSKDFSRFLELLLAMGNYMNGSTFRGGAYGFTWLSLAKLEEVRSKMEPINLVHYLVRFVDSRVPSLSQWPDSVASVEAASRLNFGQLSQQARDLRVGLTEVKQEISTIPLSSSDNFHRVMQPFVDLVSDQVSECVRMSNDLQSEYIGLLKYYGAEAGTASEDFFSVVANLGESFKRAREENAARKAKAAREAARAAKAQVRRRGGRERSGPAPAPAMRDAKGELDNLISRLRTGVAFRRRAMEEPMDDSDESWED